MQFNVVELLDLVIQLAINQIKIISLRPNQIRNIFLDTLRRLSGRRVEVAGSCQLFILCNQIGKRIALIVSDLRSLSHRLTSFFCPLLYALPYLSQSHDSSNCQGNPCHGVSRHRRKCGLGVGAENLQRKCLLLIRCGLSQSSNDCFLLSSRQFLGV